MALFNRIGNTLKQSVSRQMNLELSPSRTSIYQAIRSMSSSKLFVGGLSYGTDETSLREAFSQHGQVIEARIILDRDTGRSRGFGFVSYASSEEASSALSAFDGQDLHGRRIRVNYATEKRPGGFGGGYGSGGGFNYGGGGGGYASGNYGGGDNYGTNNSYRAGAGSYGGGMGYGSGEGGNYGGGVEQGSYEGGYGGRNSGYYNAGASGSKDLFCNSEFGGSSRTLHNGGEEQLSEDQGTESVNNDFTPEAEGSQRDDSDEPNDYANSRGC
ncbi:unnamed protein product [Withania somnifera]